MCSWSLTSAEPEVPEIAQKAIPEKELNCLIKNAFYEANGEGKTGRNLVTQVVFNRTADEKFCKTIYKPKQFSWTNSKKKRLAKIPEESYEEIRREVLELYYGVSKVPKHLAHATHYHTTWVRPAWGKSFKVSGKWKNHIFYEA
jgi:spore germination cell wall hydrolase CwlJ-like protein